MKAYVVYVKGHKLSEKYKEIALNNCLRQKWEAEEFEGITPKTLDTCDDIPIAEGSRAADFFREDPNGRFRTKKSCFNNHIRVWKKCIELNEPVAFIEQDADCIRPWRNDSFDELLILNIESAFKQKVFFNLANDLGYLEHWRLGVNDYTDAPIRYRHKNPQWFGSLMIPGTAAYAISPKGAKRLLASVEKNGWEQSDFFINTNNVHIQYVVPEYFTFTLRNLNMSHGF